METSQQENENLVYCKFNVPGYIVISTQYKVIKI